MLRIHSNSLYSSGGPGLRHHKKGNAKKLAINMPSNRQEYERKLKACKALLIINVSNVATLDS